MISLQKLMDMVDGSIDEIVNLEQKLVRIPSVNTGKMPTGNESEVCQYVSDWLSIEGIKSDLLARDAGRDNLIVNYPLGPEENCKLLLMSHTDVVPVENESKWKHDPFGGEILGGRIYGRGSSDCKALLTSQLMSFVIMNRAGVQFNRGLKLISGADEEHGGRWGFGWLADNHPEILKSEFAVNEGGGTPVELGDSLYYLLGIGEKGRMEIKITLKGESAHASVPWTGINASYGLSKTLELIRNYKPDLDTSLPLFEHLKNFGIENEVSKKNVNQIVKSLEDKIPVLASLIRALSRMTITPTIINGGIKSNSVPEEIFLTCDIRTLPFQDEDYVKSELDKLFTNVENIDYEIDYMSVPNSSPFETELAQSIKKAHGIAVGRNDITWIPSISNGFTDSRFTRNLGTITYGFSGSHPNDDPRLAMVHGTDESVGIESLVSCTKSTIALAYDMCEVQ